jgi:hypothetical protein
MSSSDRSRSVDGRRDYELRYGGVGINIDSIYCIYCTYSVEYTGILMASSLDLNAAVASG